MLAGTPVLVVREGTEEEQGRDAWQDNLAAVRAIGEALRTTLGPRGMDKLVVSKSGEVIITNDGATILTSMDVQHPAARLLVEVARAQDQECGDGTKTSVILAAELLHRAGELIENGVHAGIVARGYRLAMERALAGLPRAGRPVGLEDLPNLRRVAMTSMISKGVSTDREFLADLTVRAVRAATQQREDRSVFERSDVQVVKRPGGEVGDSELIEGIIVEREVAHPGLPRRVTGARLALMDAALEVRKGEVATEIQIRTPGEIEAYLSEEDRVLEAMVEDLRRAGANVLVCSKGIADAASPYLVRAGIYAVGRAKGSELKLLAKASGGTLLNRWHELEPAMLGAAAVVEEEKIGEERLTFVRGCPSARAVAILLRGGTQHAVDEAQRSVEDAIATVGLAVQDGLVVTGAGASAVELALDLRDYAPRVTGREQMAVEAFASALEVLPMTLAENAGMDRVGTLLELRRRHALGDRHVGVDVLHGAIADMEATAVEPVRVGRQAIGSAAEAAIMILRINDVIRTSSKATGTGHRPSPAHPMP